MKTLFFMIAMLLSLHVFSQCIGGVCTRPGKGATLNLSMLVDNSMRYYQPSGYAGIGVHAGVWLNNLGFTLGYVESKQNDKAQARRDIVFTMQARGAFLEEKIQAVPFFSVGSNNFQDAGLRLGYKVFPNTYVGVIGSYRLHYGITLMVSTSKQ